MKVITLLNEKGGVGKTTLATHLAMGMAARGAKVLLVDGAGAQYGNTLVVDAKTTPDYQLEALGIGINSAIVGKGDYTESLVGNEHSPHCDPALSPIQDPDLVIVLTPEPQPVPPTCPAIALNSTDNQFYCYTPGAGGVVPVPPAPKS